ncbi:MAG: hypothetical protein ABIL25_07770 [candidate division WOR-3 bacterium]
MHQEFVMEQPAPSSSQQFPPLAAAEDKFGLVAATGVVTPSAAMRTELAGVGHPTLTLAA